MTELMGFGALYLMLLLYVLPSVVSLRRGRPNHVSILILNITLGWTGIGWMAALLMAMRGEARK